MLPQRYRKKPVVIEAMLFDGTKGTAVAIHNWSDGKARGVAANHEWRMEVETLEHRDGEFLTASPGDYIIRGVKGEFYPCKPDIFHLTYEPIDTKGA